MFAFALIAIPHTNTRAVLYGGKEGDLENTVNRQVLHLGKQTPYPECSPDQGDHY